MNSSGLYNGSIDVADNAISHGNIRSMPQEVAGSVELPPFYYLDNFKQLIDQVAFLYSDILDSDELAFIQDFRALSHSSQCLYVRLLSRRGDWFRRDKLHYSEIPDLDSALEQLQRERFISIYGLNDRTLHAGPIENSSSGRNSIDATSALSSEQLIIHSSEWLRLFTKPELLLLNVQGTNKNQRREEIQTLVLDALESQQLSLISFSEQVAESALICVFGEQQIETLTLLFFANGYQSLTDFVLRDLGIYTYEAYSLDKTTRWCQSREQLHNHLQFYQLQNDLGDLSQRDGDELMLFARELLTIGHASDSSQASHDSYAIHASKDDNLLRRRIDHLRNNIARQLERLQARENALQIYQDSQRHPARERRLRLLVALSKNDSEQYSQQAKILVREMLDLPWSEDERQFLASFVPRNFDKATDIAKQAALHASKPDIRTLILPDAQMRTDLGVERATQTALLIEYPNDEIHYCENLLIPGVFGLLFWDAVYASVAGAFFHPFQIKPADLYHPEFIAKRHSYLEDAWHKLELLDCFREKVITTFNNKQGTSNPFVHWGYLTEDLLNKAMQRIPLSHWRACFKFMLRDLRHHKAGLPDLIRFPADGGYELIEVKGPGDTLQKNQKAWLAAFANAQMPAYVLFVKDGD
ncbi:MAG: VRR-NUC domain-containing protein [Oleibacter sp.]|nr:VRR-NUC domain-containing protein [Thalassolituus sp.]